MRKPTGHRADPADIAVALVSSLSPAARRSPPPPPPTTLPKRTPVPAVPPPIPSTDSVPALAAAARARATEAARERARVATSTAHQPARLRAPVIALLLSSAILFGLSGAALLAFVELHDDTAGAILLFGAGLAAPVAALIAASVARRLGGRRTHVAVAAALATVLGLALMWAIRLTVPGLADSIPADITALPAAAADAARAGWAQAPSILDGTLIAAWVAEAALCVAAAAAVVRAR